MGIRLRELRERRGLSVAQMVSRLDVKDSRYRKWESGAAAMPLEYATRACSILRCSLDELSGRVIPALTEDEDRLLALYRQCSPTGREYLLQMADTTAALLGGQP